VIFRSVCTWGHETDFLSLIDWKMFIADRFENQIRSSISGSKSDRDFSGTIFYRDPDRGCSLLTGIRLQDVFLLWRIAHEPIWSTQTMETSRRLWVSPDPAHRHLFLLGGSTPFEGMNGCFACCSDGFFQA